jgi:adenosylmethionine-8-amino-7-oxononanoate aminotransferase
MIASDRLIEPFLEGNNSFLHGFTFAGNPVSTAVALKNIEIFMEEKILEHVNELSPKFRAALEGLYELPIVGNVRGEGFFFGIELVKDRETKASFDADQSDRLLRGYLSGALYDAGLICRSDDRGDPVVQLAPPLISTEDELMWVVDTVRSILAGALEKI